MRTLIFALSFAVAAPMAVQHQTSLADLRRAFLDPPADSRVMMRWWWFGPAVTHAEIARELRAMKAGGIGGVEIQPVYPVALDDPSAGITTLPYLSDGFIDALRFANDTARGLGLRVDLTLGSGWPYGGPSVDISHAAGKLRIERAAATPNIGAGEQIITSFPIDGAPERQFFISSRTRMMVKRAAAGAEGFVLDHYDRSALDDYLARVGDRLMQAFAGNPPYAVFCDSLEVFASDWTPDFPDAFRKRRGYDATPLLPELAGEGPRAEAVRHDWGETLTELLADRFVTPLADWAHRQRTRLRIQAYGMPPATLSTNALADLPEGEGADWRTLSATRWASSASHVYGPGVISSETWTWLHSPVFRATPLDMKAEADRHFLQGINQLIGHGWPYSPEGVEYPGWRFYAAAVFDDKNPWWIVMPDVTRYLQRVSFVLRQGTPVVDVAIYLPVHDAWAHFTPGRVNLIETLRQQLGSRAIGSVLDAGFSFDFVDDQALAKLDPSRYRAVILPGVERLPEPTIRALERIAERGGLLVATTRLPRLAPGYTATDADHGRIRAAAERLFTGPHGQFVEDDASVGNVLGARLQPDAAFSPAVSDIGFVHRHADSGDIYFVANTGNGARTVDVAFRVANSRVESWDPMTGAATGVASRPGPNGTTSVSLHLEPYASRVLVLSRDASTAPTPASAVNAGEIDLSTGWTIAFGETGAPASLDRLRSWTDDERTRYFSGTATYTKRVDVPVSMLGRGRRVWLDFGEGRAVAPQPQVSRMQAWFEAPVREAAVVSVNGRAAGSVWSPPYRLDVTTLLKPGANDLRIVVANLAINYMAGHPLPDYRLLNQRYGVRFEPQDMDKVQPVPSGLLGPVRLMSTETR